MAIVLPLQGKYMRMKIALAQINITIGDFEGTARKIKQYVQQARNGGARLVIFPELSITGYPPRDFLEFEDFVQQAGAVLEQLKPLSRDIGILVGLPTPNPQPEGKDLHNTAVLLYQGKELHRQHKTLLPTYDIFDEYRYFEPAASWNTVEFEGLRLAVTICEDLWNLGNENPLYTINPMAKLMSRKPDIIINLSASPFDYRHAHERIRVLRANVQAYDLPIVYVNYAGAQTDLIFDGGSLVIDKEGNIRKELPFFEEKLDFFDTDEFSLPGQDNERPKEKISLIHDALITGIRDYFGKIGFRTAILGLSGGLDSAVTAALAARALGPGNITALLMPSEFSSESSVSDAKALVRNLGINAETLPITPVFDPTMDVLRPYLGPGFDVTEENIQPRIRMIYLMAFSNRFGHVLLNTSNKSELAVGYGTLYGDLAGGLSVLGDVYKTQVYELARYINRNEEIIPQNILDKPPSAELRPGQKDTDTLPPYDVLDPILHLYIEERKSPSDIIEQGYDAALVRRILRMVNRNEFKRYQLAPVLRVSPKAFGMGRRMPIVGKYLE